MLMIPPGLHLLVLNKCALLTLCGTAGAACQFMNLGRIRLSSSPWRCVAQLVLHYSSCSTHHCAAHAPCPSVCARTEPCPSWIPSRTTESRRGRAGTSGLHLPGWRVVVSVSLSHRNLSPRVAVVHRRRTVPNSKIRCARTESSRSCAPAPSAAPTNGPLLKPFGD